MLALMQTLRIAVGSLWCVSVWKSGTRQARHGDAEKRASVAYHQTRSDVPPGGAYLRPKTPSSRLQDPTRRYPLLCRGKSKVGDRVCDRAERNTNSEPTGRANDQKITSHAHFKLTCRPARSEWLICFLEPSALVLPPELFPPEDFPLPPGIVDVASRGRNGSICGWKKCEKIRC